MKRFPLDKNYAALLESYGISVEEILRRARLPIDVFLKENPCLAAEEYFNFMQAIESLVPDKKIPVQLATSENIETISPPIFAAYCSTNAGECIKRIAQYKALAGAVIFKVSESADGITVEILGEENLELPEIIVGIEMTLLLNLIRKATKKNIVPSKVCVKKCFDNPEYEKFLGCKAKIGAENSISFSLEDARIPFITRNDSMWNFFEPELKKRLSEMESDSSFSAKIRSALVELLPAGKSAIEDVAAALGLGKRTLQRKLQEEKTTFQKQLNHTRELLAKNYLQNTNLSSEDIAYLLGYQDLNSFFRAFALWTGKSLTEYKRENKFN